MKGKRTMTYEFSTRGVCARKITFDLEDGIVKNIKFLGGCSGNTQGVSKLAEGRNAKDLIEILKGTKCGFKNTSCPDQLAQALEKALEK